MREFDDTDERPVTQVGSAFTRAKELYLRLDYLESDPELIRERPEVYIHYRNELLALFTPGCQRDAWFWYSRNSNGLGRE